MREITELSLEPHSNLPLLKVELSVLSVLAASKSRTVTKKRGDAQKTERVGSQVCQLPILPGDVEQKEMIHSA